MGRPGTDRYETFVGWRYLYRRRRSRVVALLTVLLGALSVVLPLLFLAVPWPPGSIFPTALAILTVPSLLVFAFFAFLNLFSVFTTISIAGVFCGVAALTVVLSVTSGFQEQFQDKVLGLNAHALVMKWGLDFSEYREVIEKVERVPHVVAAAPFVFTEMMLAHGPTLSGAIVKGIVPGESERVLDIDGRLTGGVSSRVLGEVGADAMPRILVGVELARKLKAKVGDTVRMISPLASLDPSFWSADDRTPRMREFRIAGLLYFGFDDYDRRLAAVSLPDVQALLDGRDVVTGVEMRLDDIYRSQQVVRDIDVLLDGAPYRVIDWRELNHNLFAALQLQKVALAIVLTLIISVAAFGIIATLTMLVVDKTREIAILKSLGMRSAGVARVFQTAGMTIGALGTAAGIGIGLLVCKLVEQYGYHLDPRVYLIDRLPVRIHGDELVVTAVVTLAICFGATIYPSLRAASLPPVEGLRYH